MSPAAGPGRSCVGCGKPLSVYNDGNCCQACISAGRNARKESPAHGTEPAVDGARLAALRRARLLTQEMLAEQAGLSAVIVKKLEQNARPGARMSTLTALAQVLGIPAADLLRDRRSGGVTAPERGNGDDLRKPEESGPGRPTLMRALIAERHWQVFRTFERQFARAARELAKRDDDPGLAGLTISSRQWERWYSGKVKSEPHPDACRVLEHMFGYPISHLLSPEEPDGKEARKSQVGSRGLIPGADVQATAQAEARMASGVPSAVPVLAHSSPVVPFWSQSNEMGLAPEPPPAIRELCEVITDYGFNSHQFSSARYDEIPALGDLEREISIAFGAYQQSRFTAAASRVSVLLTDAQMAVRECGEEDRAVAWKILALTYQAAACILIKVGEPGIGWVAAERGLNATDAAGSAAIRGSLIRTVAFALHSTGRFEAAMKLVDSGTGYLRGVITGNETMLSVYGTLFLVGSMAASRFGDGPKAADYLDEAADAARRLRKDANHLWTAFGPTNVAIHRVNTAVELGDFQAVLGSGLSLDTSAVPAERRVRYLLDVARVYALTGNRDDAVSTILTAERIAPEQVRQHYLSREVVVTLMRGTVGKPGVQLDKLARRVKAHEWA